MMAWESVPGNSAGAMNGDGSRKLLLHSTEGFTVEGALGAYRQNNSWPTLTVDCPRRRVVRHLADTVAARSLRNRSGGVETNRDGTILIQIELMGFAGSPETIGSREDLVWLGTEVVGPLCKRNSIPLTSSVRWAPYPSSYGLNATQRLSPAAWDGYSGVLGHMHAPENDHGDPGAIDIETILSAARGEDDVALTDPEHQVLYSLNNQVVNAVLPKLNALAAAVAKIEVGDDLDEAQVAQLVLAGLSAEAIADALDDGIAAEVADLLSVRLGS